MDAVRKALFDDPMFPFQLVFQDTKSPQRELPEHLHELYEMVYIYKGKGTFFINRNFYEMNAGDVFLIPGDTIHRAFPDPDDPVTSTAVFFSRVLVPIDSSSDSYSSLYCYELARKRKRYKFEASDSLRMQLESALLMMHQETCEKQLGYKQAVRLHLQQLLLRFNRAAVSEIQADTADIQVGPGWMKDILQYMDEHHAERGMGLSALAERVSVTAAHFSRVFKQLTGMNVTDYVNAKRIVRAKELLLTTEASIDVIADRCGFDSLPYFHRVFKAATGLTPGIFRRQR
ncbi:AraC family transcriptional regulator [Paenibacillus hexagrammi]|uniref:AraC family transcriptional regulator n=1 Tax=Paenibacillus hexagrammi TaxID=2908839 RepID=A0ABY3SEF5_9BACL|nr:AraC family transcriptional regulator [Paenibacillus sp. YPD9-1]UJF32373.1 AraC family transcriptional regulator [Paenibacillus sp. YPD9-1]